MTTQRGSIQKRGPDKHLIRVYLGTDPNTHKRVYKSQVIHGSWTDAQKALTALLSQSDISAIPVTSSTPTLKEWSEAWLKMRPTLEEPPSARTMDDYRYRIEKYILPALGSVKLQSLTDQQCRLWLAAQVEKGLSPRSRQYNRAVLNILMVAARQQKLIRVNPLEDVTAPKLVKRQVRVLTADEMQLLFTESRWSLLWRVALSTGLRPQEYLALKWDAIDLGNRELRVKRVLRKEGIVEGKAKSDGSFRTVSLDAALVAALKAVPRDISGLVFPGCTGTPLSVHTVRDRWYRDMEKILKLAPGTTGLYDARHSHATLLVANGVPMKMVQARLGHSSYALTANTYSHASRADDVAAADVFEAVLKKA